MQEISWPGLLYHALAWLWSYLTTLWTGTERRWICLPQAHHLCSLAWQPCAVCVFLWCVSVPCARREAACGEEENVTQWPRSPELLIETCATENFIFLFTHNPPRVSLDSSMASCANKWSRVLTKLMHVKARQSAKFTQGSELVQQTIDLNLPFIAFFSW